MNTGRVLVDGKYSSYQHCICALLYAFYELDHPKNPYKGDVRFLNAAWRVGEYIMNLADKNGHFYTVKTDGSEWGYEADPWIASALGEVLLRSAHLMPDSTHQRWLQKMAPIWAQDMAYSTGPGTAGFNHTALHKWSGYLGALCRNNAADKQFFGDALANIAVYQEADGYWNEGIGPSVLYNFLYLQALAVYWLTSGDPRVETALIRGARFHSFFIYPDCSIMSLISCRVGYNAERSLWDIPAMCVSLESRYYLEKWLQSPLPLPKPSLNWFMPIFNTLLYVPELTASTPLGGETADWKPADIPVKKICSGPWVVTLSGFTGSEGNRWVMDRSVYFSVWNEQSGLICGDNLSKNQASWSNFNFDGSFIANTTVLSAPTAPPSVSLTFSDGMYQGVISIPEISDTSLSVEFKATGMGTIYGGLPLYIHYPDMVCGADTILPALHDTTGTWKAVDLGGVLRHRGINILLPYEASLLWPFPVYNPYVPDGQCYDFVGREPYALVKFPLNSGNPVRLTFTSLYSVVELGAALLPLELSLSPNPFNMAINLMVSDWKSGWELKILDIHGKIVVDLTTVLNSGPRGSGLSQVSWNASGYASGVYVVILHSGNVELKRKVVLIR